jgi:maltooligosyltrehalose trehalohydrolase
VHEWRHEEMLEWYRRLIALRRGSPSLNDGDPGQTKVSFDEDKKWMVMERGAVTVMSNLGVEPVELDNPQRLALALASRPDVEAMEGRIVLPSNTLAVLSGEKSQQSV